MLKGNFPSTPGHSFQPPTTATKAEPRRAIVGPAVLVSIDVGICVPTSTLAAPPNSGVRCPRRNSAGGDAYQHAVSERSQAENLLGLIDAAQLKMSSDSRRPSQRPAASANRDENRICRLTGSQSFSIRTTSLTAGPITVKSSRSTAPTVAVQHFADVQSDINICKRQVCRFTFQVANFQVGRRLDSSIESLAANSLLVPFIERDRRQHRIADEFEHVTSARPQRRGQYLKSIVQHSDNRRAGRHVADPRKTAQVSVPKHRPKAVDRSTLDRA